MIPLREEQAALRRASAPVLKEIGHDIEAASVYQIRDLLTYILEELFSVELTVAAWMKACELPLQNGSTLFEAQMGVAPETYLWDRRLETSAGLLLDTDFQPGQVAQMVCFSNKQTFKRRFRAWSGLTPDAFRREIQKLPGLFTESGESLLSGHLLARLLTAGLTDGEAGELIAEMKVRNADCWMRRPPVGPLERFFAREIWENLLVPDASEHEVALYELCFTTPALKELLMQKAAEVDDEDEDEERGDHG